MVVVLVLLWLKDRRAAAWLAVPAVWPASEFHYSTLALPVMTPILAVLLAPNIQRLPPVAILVDGIWRLAGPTLRRMTRDWLEADRNVTLDAGIVKPVLDKTFPLDRIQEALAYSESGRATGKVTISI